MRILIAFLFTLMLPVMAAAQSDEVFQVKTRAEGALSTEEYNDIPKGMMIPPAAPAKNPDGTDVVAPESTMGAVAPGAPEGEATTIIASTNSAVVYETGLAAYKKSKYDEALKSLEPLAKNGHLAAQELVGVMYRMGQGTAKQPEKGLELLLKSAEEKRPLAMHHLGILHYTADGVEGDPVKGLMWMHLAIIYYPPGPEKTRAEADRDNMYASMSRRDKETALEQAREWLDKKGDIHLMDFR